MPLIEVARTKTKPEALEALERWKAKHPDVVPLLQPADVLVDGMRGSSSLWYRIRVNLQHVPEAQRPAQEAARGRLRPVGRQGVEPAVSDLGPVDPGHAGEAAWLRRWRLRPDGDPITTASSTLMPVRTEDGEPAMLKLAHTEEEVARRRPARRARRARRRPRARARTARRCCSSAPPADRDLVRMAEGGEDDEATRIICDAADRIHAASAAVLGSDDPPELVDLPTWFRHLFAEADALGRFHRRGADVAAALLDDPRDPVVLHGDLHHGNVLDFGERGWLAIDPKGLLGEAAFDYCNLLCNPSHERALAPGRLERQFGVVVDGDRRRARRGSPTGSSRGAPCRRRGSPSTTTRGSRTPRPRSASGRWRSAALTGASAGEHHGRGCRPVAHELLAHGHARARRHPAPAAARGARRRRARTAR